MSKPICKILFICCKKNKKQNKKKTKTKKLIYKRSTDFVLFLDLHLEVIISTVLKVLTSNIVRALTNKIFYRTLYRC